MVFLPGLAEGLFPQRMLEDPLLLDELREAVSAHLPLRKQRVNDERMRLHLAVAAARDGQDLVNQITSAGGGNSRALTTPLG